MNRIAQLMVEGVFRVGKSCPPGGHCNITGTQNPRNMNLEGRAILKDNEEHIVAQAKFLLTEDFIDEIESTIPEGLYAWYPRYSGGDIPSPQKIEELRNNFHQLLQDWLCNYTNAIMILEGLAKGRASTDPSRTREEGRYRGGGISRSDSPLPYALPGT